MSWIVWLLSVCHVPWVVGETGGRCDPSTLLTGRENVSVIGVVDLTFDPGAGLATAVAPAPAGNQLTPAGRERSQVRGCPDRYIEPADDVRGRVIVAFGEPRATRCRWAGSAP